MGESSNYFDVATETKLGNTSASPPVVCNPTSVAEVIEKSKSHWSHLAEFESTDEVAEESNVELFRCLQKHPKWGTFFQSFGEGEDGELVVGKKIAEGGQAEIFEAQILWNNAALRDEAEKNSVEWVVKVFKKGTFLRHLQAQWPQGMLQFYGECFDRLWLGLRQPVRFTCDVHSATLLQDGRFAFIMVKEAEDLRRIIDRLMLTRPHGMGPFSTREAEICMYLIARGMDQLHNRGIVHRDIKASNVLFSSGRGYFLADFECSVGVVGTGFFRAPEILQACKEKNVSVSEKGELFTKAVDVYSYGMTCFEIVTGKLPFENCSRSDYDVVLLGQRPELPKHVKEWVCDLLRRCWSSNPKARPTSKEILEVLFRNSAACRKQESITRELELYPGLRVDWEEISKVEKLGRLLKLFMMKMKSV